MPTVTQRDVELVFSLFEVETFFSLYVDVLLEGKVFISVSPMTRSVLYSLTACLNTFLFPF